MQKRNLHLVVSNCEINEKSNFMKIIEKIKNFIECIMLSKNEKLYIIKDFLIKLYKDYEETTGIIDIPYFVRADIRISKIIKDKKIDYYYLKLKKFKNTKIN